MKLPNNKIIYLGVFIVLIITIVISYNEYKKNIPERNPNTENVESIKPTIVVENNYQNADSDADGLSDWEEMLWKTDPKKKDSDSDGTSDGEEVALSRDPLKKGPNDKYNEENVANQNYIPFFEVSRDTLTSQIAKTILSKSTAAEGSAAITEINNQIKAELDISKIYKKENLITFDPQDKEMMEEYSNHLMKITIEEIQNSTIDSKNIYNYADSYRNMALRLSVIEVPQNFTGLHTDYINNFNSLSVMARRIVDAKEDPIVLLATIPEYEKVSDSQALILEQIKLYYKNNDIIFANVQ